MKIILKLETDGGVIFHTVEMEAFTDLAGSIMLRKVPTPQEITTIVARAALEALSKKWEFAEEA